MSELKRFDNVKAIVFIGYMLLFALAVFGLIRIYRELVDFSESENPLVERKELNVVSNALVALYEAESMRKMMLSDNFYPAYSKSSYNAMDAKVNLYIDSLYQIASDDDIRIDIDTVKILLDEKRENFYNMIALMDSVKKLPYSNVLSTTVLSKRDISDLGNIIHDKMVVRQDTSYYIKEKKNFVGRLRSLFSSKPDSTKVVKASSTSTATQDTLSYTPTQMLTDTIVEYINTINEKSDRRKAAYLAKLSVRQNVMIYYDEQLTQQINQILRRIEQDELQLLGRIEAEKRAVLQRSSGIVSRIAIASLVALILFLSITLTLISRNQKYRTNLEESNIFTRRLLKSRERLLLMISHDVKSPLSSIIGHIELMSDEKMTMKDKEHLQSMRMSSEQILDLSNKLMDFHRLEQGKSEVSVVPFLPFRLMKDIYKSFLPFADKKELELVFETEIDPNQAYESDPFMIKQIVNNLVNNALKFTEKGSVRVKSQVGLNSEILQISIKDTGVGIKNEDLQKIFEDFERVGTAEAKQAVEGFGLGLPITKRLVTLLKGDIAVTSHPGKGTEFRVFIPLPKSEEVLNGLATGKTGFSPFSNEKKMARVLWVDDDEAILNVQAKLLERKGIQVEKCTDPTKAIPLIRQHTFDMIFTDIQMPEMDGFELVAQIRALDGALGKLPVVAFSARSDVSEKDFRTAGFTAFLPKPVPFDLLYQLIFHLINPEEEVPREVSPANDAEGFNALIEYVKDDREVSLEILHTFLEDNRAKTAQLKKAVEPPDWKSIQTVSHKMLPLMIMIKEDPIAEILAKLDAGEKDLDAVKRLIPLVEQVNKAAEEFTHRLKNSSVNVS